MFGPDANLLQSDVWAIVAVGGAALVVVSLFWKEIKLLAFDPEYAAGLGFPVRSLDFMLTGLIVVAVVVGLQSVGVVLMSALVVAPAAAARQWSDRLGAVTLLAGLFGGSAGVSGTLASHYLSDPTQGRSVPTGPTVVLCATSLVTLSFAVRRVRSRGRVAERLA